MYQDFFTNNFILNFLTSFLFLSTCILCSISVSVTLNNKKINLLNEFQPIIIFFNFYFLSIRAEYFSYM